jgi:sortase (surface protein transpeptidase)
MQQIIPNIIPDLPQVFRHTVNEVVRYRIVTSRVVEKQRVGKIKKEFSRN